MARAISRRGTTTIFLFDNPKGPHTEYWQHVLGCRRWFRLNRNTATNEIGGPA